MLYSISILAGALSLAGGASAWGLSIPLGPPPAPPKPAGCGTNLQLKPLGQVLLGPLFPNPYSNVNVPLNVPNCNAPAPAPAPSSPCPSGQSCLNTANPCPSGEQCKNSQNPCPSGEGCKNLQNPCTAGEECKNSQNPCASGKECLTSPRFPSAQTSGDGMCNAGWNGPPLRACIDPQGSPTNCCA